MASKILVVGATNGRFLEALTKITALHAKNNFTLALHLGSLFISPSDPLAATLLHNPPTIPLPIYFTLGSHPLPPAVSEHLQTSPELCPNLIYLGKKTTLNTSTGIRIVTLGGRLDASLIASTTSTTADASSDLQPFYTTQDAASLRGALTADLLVTYEWPTTVQNGSQVPCGVTEEGSRAVAELAAAVRPRYHFAPGGSTFWEREPYRNGLREGEGQGEVNVTRFISVADWGNEGGAKALYAFVVDKSAPIVVPPNATGCPYKFSQQSRGQKRGREEGGGAGGTFFWGNHTGGGGDRRDRDKRGRRAEKAPPPGPESCFFCLSYPQLEKHLIVSIGNEAYLTTAKGPLTNPGCNPAELPFSAHILIIPLTHTSTLGAIEEEEARKSTLEEMGRYRSALESMLRERGCGAVTFEIARRRNVHAHWQVVPVPMEKMGEVEEAFREEAKRDRVGEFERRAVTEGEDYFRVWMSGKKKEEKGEDEGLVVELAGDQYFDLQFGRRVLAKVLGLKTVHWKDCVLPFEEEVKDANAFKEAFKPFDFSL